MYNNQLQLSKMKRKMSKTITGLGLGLAFSFISGTVMSQTTFGISGNNLVSFNITTPGTISTIGTFSGILPGQSIMGMDFRPLTGELYALGYDASTGAARLYTVNLTTASLTPIGSTNMTFDTGETYFGFDFNPTVDRIRVVTSTDNNYRLHPITGTIAVTDLNIAYLGTDVNAASDASAIACAYTNSYIAATSTALYVVDGGSGNFTLQNPPNNGSLNTIANLGPIALQIAPDVVDLDAYFDPMTLTNTMYLIGYNGTNQGVYTVNTTTGATTMLGTTGGLVSDFAVQIIVNTPPTVSGQLVYGLTSNGYLMSFDSGMPSTVRSHKSLSGVTAGQTLVGMDSRPLNGQLYAMGYNGITGETQLYIINPTAGTATSVAPAITLATGMTNISFDFNPTVDRIRVTSAQDNNYRLHPITGAIVTTDGVLAYALTDVNSAANPNIGAGAYTNSYIGGTSTQLFNYDVSLNVLTLQNPPNNGTLNTVGTSGITVNVADPSVDFDFFYNTTSGLNQFYAIANTTNTFDNLYTVNTTTGAFTSVGLVGFGTALIDMAVEVVLNTPAMVNGQLVYGLTSNGYLISFDSGMPSTVRSHASLSGVTAGQTLVGLDSRPATGELYALGYNATTGDAQLYTINTTTSTATSVAPAVTLAIGMSAISFDFNPTVDRIRVTSAQDNNYRLHPTTGAIVSTDGVLAYAGTDVNSAMNPSIGAGAYTNSFIGGTSTSLFNYDATLNVVTFQNPPNNGTLNTIGASGITVNVADPSIDFDFFYNSVTGMNENYAVANTANTFDNLYTVNTTSGAFTSVGVIGNGIAVVDMAVQIVPNIPAMVSGQLVYGITSNQYLITFDSDAPSVVRTHVAVTGITAGQTIAGLDVRPATGQLYALGYNSTTGDAQLYTIDPVSAVATSVAAPVTLATAMGNIGFDFNPTVDRIRVVSSTGNNYRLHPTTGAIAATDGTLAYAVGDVNNGTTPMVGSGAYTNSYGGSNNTKLYVYDDALNSLALQNPPNNGTLNTIGTSGIVQSTSDVTSDLDIFYNHNLHTNTAYMISNSSLFDMFYTVNTTSGAVTAVGSIGNGIAVRDIAVKNDSITVVSSSANTIAPTVCSTYTAPDNTVYTTSGTYTAIIPNAIGYDSLITINLIVNVPTTSTINPIVCGSYTAPDNMMYTVSGMYMATISNAAGCDSVITINLTVNNVNNGVTLLNDTMLMATETGGSYQWLDCNTGMPIAGATMQNFAPTANGSYSVAVTSASGCTDTSACTVISILAINDVNTSSFSIAPNPSTGLFTVSLSGTENGTIIVRDAMGRFVAEQTINGTQAIIDLSSMTNGVYFVKVGSTVKQVVKN